MEPFGRTPFSLMGMNMFKLFFSFSGRINRARFWAVIAFWLLVRVGVPYLLYTFALLPGQSLDIQDASASPQIIEAGKLYAVLTVVSLFSTVSAAVRRLHDFDASGLWAILLFIPGIEFIAYLVIGLIGSQRGTNRYGVNPLGENNIYFPGNEEMRVKELKDLATLFEKGLLSEAEYEKAKKELKKQDAEIDRKGKIAALFCKAYEKAVLLTPSEENIRCWTDGTRMPPEEMRATVKESRELAEVCRTSADICEQKILPADWRCADAESEENDAQPDGNPA